MDQYHPKSPPSHKPSNSSGLTTAFSVTAGGAFSKSKSNYLELTSIIDSRNVAQSTGTTSSSGNKFM
jgi:hypothetical protein